MFFCHFATGFDFPGVLEKMAVLIMVSAHKNRPNDPLKTQGKYICVYCSPISEIALLLGRFLGSFW
jgi:hypothetical protein